MPVSEEIRRAASRANLSKEDMGLLRNLIRGASSDSIRALAERAGDLEQANLQVLAKLLGAGVAASRVARLLLFECPSDAAWALLLPLVAVGAEVGLSRCVVELIESEGVSEIPAQTLEAALTFLRLCGEERAQKVAERLLMSIDQSPGVRAEAAEALGYLFECHPLVPGDSLVRAIGVGLMAQDPGVRFWSAYAAGNVRAKALVPLLQSLFDDPSEVSTFWSVGREARDAVALIAAHDEEETADDA